MASKILVHCLFDLSLRMSRIHPLLPVGLVLVIPGYSESILFPNSGVVHQNGYVKAAYT
jgi:hypothetical protein